MNIYLTFSQIPELSPLSRKQRQLVVQRCIYPAIRKNRYLLYRLPSYIAAGLAATVASYFCHNIFVPGIAAGLAVGFASHFTDTLLAAKLRPEIRRFVDENKFWIVDTP